MKTIQAIVIGILVLLLFQDSFAKDPIDETALALKKWGLAYCLAAHSEDAGMQMEAKPAMKWYRTRGPKDEKAFMAVRDYFDNEIANDHGGGKDGGNVNLMKCLNAYTRVGYGKLLEKLDKR